MAVTRQTVTVGVFDSPQQAANARERLQEQGWVLLDVANPTDGTPDALLGVLVEHGVPEGSARYYDRALQEGRSIVVVEAPGHYEASQEALRELGARDVESEGGDLVREGSGAQAAAPPLPAEVTGRWEDVHSRYEMLFAQRFGASDATWEQYQPIYRWAWETATAARQAGRSWEEAEADLRRQWQTGPSQLPWSDAAEAARDVWDDVATEAARGAEGGEHRRTARHADEGSVPPA